jgi:hypothetical protein
VEKPAVQKNASADAESRRKAVIAAAEAREKKHIQKTKPIKSVTKTTLAREKQQQQILSNAAAAAAANNSDQVSNEPLSDQARQAAAAAKQGEAALAAQLGYNPYETARSTAGQARTATSAVQHGTMTAPGSAGDHLPSTAGAGVVAPPRDAALPEAEEEPYIQVDLSPDFEDAYALLASSDNEPAAIQSSCSIMKKLMINATTKGQMPGEDAAKFRKVRLVNPKIKAALVDVQGAVEVMLSVGFSLDEQEGESVLIFPADYPGPEWLPTALRQLESLQ